jgi:hypothetical protein
LKSIYTRYEILTIYYNPEKKNEIAISCSIVFTYT